MLLWDFGHQTACSQKDFGGRGYINVSFRFFICSVITNFAKIWFHVYQVSLILIYEGISQSAGIGPDLGKIPITLSEIYF